MAHQQAVAGLAFKRGYGAKTGLFIGTHSPFIGRIGINDDLSGRGGGLGSTGGGVDPLPKLSWEALAQDLSLARAATDDVAVFSLEGCVAQGFLTRLAEPLPPATPPLLHRAAARVGRDVLTALSRAFR